MSKKLIFFFFLFILVGLIVRNFQLRDVLFHDWDESIYAQVGYEVMQHKSLAMTYNGSVWIEKPPLLPFILASTFTIFGRSEIAARGLMLILGYILLIMIFFLTKKLLRISFLSDRLSKLKPVTRTLITLLPTAALASSHFFLDRSAIVNEDILLSIGWVGYFLFRENFYLKLFFLTLGVFSKSILGFYPMIYDIFFIKGKTFTYGNLRKNLRYIFFLIIPLLWHFWGILRYGNYFLQVNLYDHLLKRLTTPLELHFGGKFFYLNLLWQDYGIFLVVFLLGYLLFGIEIFRNVLKNRKKNVLSVMNWSVLVFLSAIPYLMLLTVGKSKISWYVFALISLLTLIVAYLALAFRTIYWRYACIAAVACYFLFTFVRNTYLFVPAYRVPDKTIVALCIAKHQGGKAAFLVDKGERDVRHLLEAAQLEIQSSFVYGGSPSFIFYVQKPVDIYYNPSEFWKNSTRYRALVVNQDDLKQNTISPKFINSCSSGDWRGFTQ